MYKFDTHIHTSEVSICGMLTAVQTVKLYKEKNFDGIVITDHYNEYFFSKHEYENLTWSEKVAAYLAGYYNALKYGEFVGMTVLLGIELQLKNSANEYLLYGIDLDLLIDLPEMYNYTIEQLREVTKKYGITVFQAHPFRPRMTAMSAEFVDGCEVYNGNPRHNSQNDVAEEYAEQNGLLKLSGSDCHKSEDVAQGGVILSKRITSPQELVEEIIADRAKLIKNGE